MRVEVTDVFLRDGLQDEDVIVPTADKLEVAARLVRAGVRSIEAASFVNPRKVPQMADAPEVFAALPHRSDVAYRALALNGRGIQRAVAAGARHIAVVSSASTAHSRANAGHGIEEAIAGLGEEMARHPGATFHAGISTAFTCPFEGRIEPRHLLRIARAFKDLGIPTVGLADTLGTTPTEDVIASLDYVRSAEPGLEFYLHLHNAHGEALKTVRAAVNAGITRFESALGGYGGCPFAPGAPGNIATEDLVGTLHEAGHETGIDEEALHDAVAFARAALLRAPAAGAAAAPSR